MAIDTSKQLQQIVDQIRQLTPEQQLELMSELASIIRQNMPVQEPTKPKRKRSIMELEGLGKEIWEGVDVEQYIRELRGPYPDEE